MSDTDPQTPLVIPQGVMDWSHCASCGVKLDARTGAFKINDLRYQCADCWRNPREYWMRKRRATDG